MIRMTGTASLIVWCFLSIEASAQDSAAVRNDVGRLTDSSAATGPQPGRWDLLADDARIVLSDVGDFFSAPLRWETRDWGVAAAGSAGTLLLMAADKELQQRLGRETEQTINNDFWDIPTQYGYVQYANAAALLTYTTGLAAGWDDLRVTGRLLFESLTNSGIAVIVARTITGRNRPYGTNSPWGFRWFEWGNEVQSFPSGHVVVAFGFSTVIAERSGSWPVRIAAYGMALLTAFARVHNNQHWVSDAVVGAALGIAGGLHAIGRERERDGVHLRQEGLLFQPIPGGVRVSWVLP
jgi:membrane-associated phospholipid phosphatase